MDPKPQALRVVTEQATDWGVTKDSAARHEIHGESHDKNSDVVTHESKSNLARMTQNCCCRTTRVVGIGGMKLTRTEVGCEKEAFSCCTAGTNALRRTPAMVSANDIWKNKNEVDGLSEIDG